MKCWVIGIGFVVLATITAHGDTIAGHVVNSQGEALPGARVFVELGLAHNLIETRAGTDGAFRFDDVTADTSSAGAVGVFAIADGTAFGGVTLNLLTEPDMTDLVIRLSASGNIAGTVADFKKRPVQGARITRVGLLDTCKVGIPLAKLQPLGFPEPATDAEGRFVVPNMPAGGHVALKVAHTDFAQEAVEDTAVGVADCRIALIPGILVQGSVQLRDGKTPVADVPVIVRNAQPPHDTAIVRTNGGGAFTVRLKPGAYLYQVAGGGYRNAGWERLAITGAEPQLKTVVYVSGEGTIRGKICDAATGQPIARAKIALDTQGNAAAVLRTSQTGEFVFSAMDGENIVRIDTAAGYLPPEQPAIRVNVVTKQATLLPTFWLAPIPAYTVEIVDAQGKPAPGVVVTMVRPEQYGWRVTDAQGRVSIQFASLPPEGPVLGLAEAPQAAQGAFFAIDRQTQSSAKVELRALGSVHGRVLADNHSPVQGALVAAVFGKEGCTLWRTVTDSNGVFGWNSVVPNVPQYVSAYDNATPADTPFQLLTEPGATVETGDLAGSSRLEGISVLGKSPAWHEGRLIAGHLPDAGIRSHAVVVATYSDPAGAAAAIEGFTKAQTLFPEERVLFVVVVDGPFAIQAAAIPVLAGKAPGRATTYVIHPGGAVGFETFGMPPLRAIQAAATP